MAQEIISEKLTALLKGVNSTYGKILTEELLSRLENTIVDFNEEVKTLLEELKSNAMLKQQLLSDVKSGQLEDQSESNEEVEEASVPSEMSEWEKRLESLSKK